MNMLRPQLSALLLLLIMGLSAVPCDALEVEQLQARYRDGEYQLTLTATLNAPLHAVETVLRDYAGYPGLDSRILTAQVLSRADHNQLELFTRLNVCVAFVCRKLERVEHVEERPGELVATIIPERSDAERGSTHTQLIAIKTPQGERTRVIYRSQIVPKFWVPALVGRSLMLRNFREATISLFDHIEQRANVLPGVLPGVLPTGTTP